MEIEFRRGKRHGYPVCCLAIRPDRLDQLSLIHGQESKEEVLGSVVELVRRTIRAGDLLGFTENDRLILILPHLPSATLHTICTRIIAGASNLVFDTGPRSHRITLSVGASHSSHPEAGEFSTLERVALDGLEVAEAAGGDRWIESELYGLESREDSERRDSVPVVEAEQLVPNYRERLVELVSEGGSLEDAARELADEIVRRALQAQGAGALSGSADEADLLRRRMAKLTRSLGVSEQELLELRAFKQASIDRGESNLGVAGERSMGTSDGLRADLMRTIFEANLDLRRDSGRDAS